MARPDRPNCATHGGARIVTTGSDPNRILDDVALKGTGMSAPIVFVIVGR